MSLVPHNRDYGSGKRLVVVGAGPAGLLTAILLAQRGYQVDASPILPLPLLRTPAKTISLTKSQSHSEQAP